MISNKKLKNYLKNAELFIQGSYYEKAIEEIAKAYATLYQTDDELLEGKWSFWSSNYRKINTLRIPNTSGHADQFASRIAKSLREVSETVNINLGRIDESIKILSLGIDYRKYRKLMTLIPGVYKDSKGKLIIVSKPEYDKHKLPDNAQFCFDLLLECVLKVQDGSIS